MMRRLSALLLAAIFGSIPSLPAATKTWDGSANGNWSVGANWSGGTAPNAGDDLVFPSGASARRNTTNNFILGSAMFRSIRFEGVDYRIYGAVIALTNGINATGVAFNGLAGTNTINAAIELRASQTFTLFASPSALLDINGDIALGAHTLTVNNGGFGATVHFDGVISGSGGITKVAGGTLRFGGIFANTYTGPTRINIGRLDLNKGLIGGATAISGDLIVGDGMANSTPDRVQLLRDDQIADTSDVTVNDDGLLDLNGFDDTIASLTLNGGTVDSGAGRLTLDGHVTATSTTNGVATIEGNLSLGPTSQRYFTVDNGPFGPDLRIQAVVSGFSGLGKAGDGELNLNAANLYTGETTVEAGLLTVTDDGALGSTSSGTVVSSGATISVRFTTHVGNESLTLNGNGLSSSFGALSGGSGSNSWSGPITLTSDSTVGTADGSFLNLLNVISGAGDLTKIGGGTLIYSGGLTNTYTGATRVHEGTLLLWRTGGFGRSIPGDLFIGDGAGGPSSDVVRIEGSSQINSRSAVTIAASGFLDQNAPYVNIGSLAGVGRVDIGTNHLSVGNNDASTSYGGQILGSQTFSKVGRGTLTLTGDNAFSGTMIPGPGTLLVNGTQPRSDVIVGAAVLSSPAGTLGGRGALGNLTVFGHLAPGASPGILSCSNLTFSPGADYSVELNGANPGTGHDQMNVRGSVLLSGAGLLVSRGFLPAANQRFVILSNDGTDAISGVFNGLAEGTAFPVGGLLFRITYTGGDGNDVALTRISAPASTITSITTLPTGDRHLAGLGLPGLIYIIEGATNLNAPIPWVPLGEVQANSAGLYEWIDLDAPSHPKRFYRAQSP